MMRLVKIAPSILASDHGNLASEAKKLESWGADWIHVDVMDGVFAPNLTFGPGLVKSLRRVTTLSLDCHLMLSEPEKFVKQFVEAGGDVITVHAEALRESNFDIIADQVSNGGAKLGVAFKPATSLGSFPVSKRPKVSLVTVMTVNPGFSGQKLMASVIPKVKEASLEFLSSDRKWELEVDGGVDVDNARLLCENGATVLVAGNSIFGQQDPKTALQDLRSKADGNDSS